MKRISKKQRDFFLVVYDQMVRKLRQDLIVYRRALDLTLIDIDKSQFTAMNLDDPNEMMKLAKFALLHRIKGFDGEKFVSDEDNAVNEVMKIINGKKE